MIYINGLGFIEDKTGTTNRNSTQQGTSFDSVLQTTIYAQPAGSGTQKTASAGSSSTSSDTATPYDAAFRNAADRYHVDVNLLKAVAKAESNFNAGSVSGAGAIGVMQLMPSTASSLGVSNPYDATENILGGARYLSQLLSKYNGNTSLALAAYNAGSGNVDKYGGIPPFKETQNYVNKVLGYYARYGDSGSAASFYAAAGSDATATSRSYIIQAVPDSSV